MRALLARLLVRVPQNGTAPPSAGEDASIVDAPAYLFRDVRRPQLADRAIEFLRSSNPLARRAKAAVQALFSAELPAWPIYRLLATERFARMVIGRHLLRAAYHRRSCGRCAPRPANG